MCKSLLASSVFRTLANVNIVNIEIISGAITAEAFVLKAIELNFYYIIISYTYNNFNKNVLFPFYSF